MLYKEYINIRDLALHRIGSKPCNEGVHFSNEPIILDDELNALLKTYFLRPFKSDEYYNFTHSSDLCLNELFHFAEEIFMQKSSFLKVSKQIASYLYECSSHPNIKRGELYVVYFENCILDGETIDAIGIFKSENKDKFIKVYPTPSGFGIEQNEGISINKLDKGCLIYNLQKENGYVLSIIDNTNKVQGSEAKYWTESFLHVKPRHDSYQQTNQIISLCKEFTEHFAPTMKIGKLDKINIMSRALESLSDGCNNIDTLAARIFDKDTDRADFSKYAKSFQANADTSLDGIICVNSDVLKKAINKRATIKLDKSFEIRLLGNSQENIIRGYDALKKMFYYTIFFKNEQ